MERGDCHAPVVSASFIEIVKDILRMLRPGKGCLPF